LEEVRAEVTLMQATGATGPATLLQSRLAARGVRVTTETLRSGDCRALLEQVWTYRRSRRRHGPTRGHDLRRHEQLVDHVIDLEASVARVKADLQGRVVSTGGEWRDPRSIAVCRYHADCVARTAATIVQVVRDLGAAGEDPDYRNVSEELGRRGHPLSVRSIQRREEYWRPILEYLSISKPRKPVVSNRKALMRMARDQLGARIVKLQAEVSELNAQFEAYLVRMAA
jgi:hypothetical protein